MYIFPLRINAMLAVVPAVDGRPDAVLGHLSVHKIILINVHFYKEFFRNKISLHNKIVLQKRINSN